MKTPFPSLPARVSPTRWVLLAWVVAGCIGGWGSARLMAAESDGQAPVAPPPEVNLKKIPVLRLQKVELTKAKPSRKAASQKSVEKRRRGKVVLTGSNIPQSVTEGRIQVTSSPVLVIDRREMSRTGAQTASQLFGHLSFGR